MTINSIDEYLNGASWLIKENANQARSYSQMKGYIADKDMKEYTLQRYPSNIRKLHDSAYIHIHDLSNGIVPYCYGADLLDLLTRGLWTTHVISTPPKHFRSALDQLVNYFTTSQNEWAGAQAVGDFNTILAPYVNNDGLTYEQVKQDLQSFVFQLNYPSRSSNESPFTNVMLNTTCPSSLKNTPVHLKNLRGTSFADYHDESIMIMKAFNEILYEGDGAGRPFTFPIPTINLIKDTDFSDPLWTDIAMTEAKFGSYYFMNYIGTGIDANSVKSMCCRLSLDLSELPPAGGRWAHQGGTGSIGIVSLNMAKLGYISRDEAQLYNHLEGILGEVKKSLLIKNKWVQSVYDNGMMPLTSHYEVDFDRFFRTIGLIGLHEMVVNMTGNALAKEQALTARVLTYLREWTKRTQIETGKLWNLEMTPGEGAATRFAMVDRSIHNGIFTQGTPEAPYYTTLMTPPSTEMGVVERIGAEQDLLSLFTGGTVHRIYIGEKNPNPKALWKLTERIAKNSKIPYFDFAATFGICPVCNQFEHGSSETCGKCGSPTDVYSRVTGYYRPHRNMNVGKLQEFRDRKYVGIQ